MAPICAIDRVYGSSWRNAGPVSTPVRARRISTRCSSTDERPDVVLASSAMPDQPGSQAAAREPDSCVVKRDQFLPALLSRRRVIAVAGAHGKSTTTSMIIRVLREARPRTRLHRRRRAARSWQCLGRRQRSLRDRSRRIRPHVSRPAPTVAVITNVEWDHPDCYPTPASFRRAFMQFVDQVDRDGLVVSCMDDDGAETDSRLRRTRGPKWITYGTGQTAQTCAPRLRHKPDDGN